MKKSEMTKLMTEHWFGLFPNEPAANMNAEEFFPEVQEKMGNLLDRMIRKGMKPPARTPEENYVGLFCEWEAEDGNV